MAGNAFYILIVFSLFQSAANIGVVGIAVIKEKDDRHCVYE